MKNLLVAQSGGPSVAINATLAGVVEKAMTNQNVGKIYGAKNGIMGILTDKLIDLTEALADPEPCSCSARHHPLRLAPAA